MTVTTEKQKTVAPGKLNWSLDQKKKKAVNGNSDET